MLPFPGGTLHGEVAQVLCRPETAGENYRIKLSRRDIFDVDDLPPGYTGRLRQHIPFAAGCCSGQMIYLGKFAVRSHADRFRTIAVNGEQGEDRFVDFASVVHAASRKYNTYLLFHRFLLLS
jgi:hypothetical protein